MGGVVRYISSVELGAQYTAAPVPTSETDAITIKNPHIDSASVADIATNTQATLLIKFTIGSLTNVKIRVYGSHLENPTATDWYQEVIETDASGVATLDKQVITLAASTTIAYHKLVGAYKAYKVTVEGTGTATNSTLTLNLALRVN